MGKVIFESAINLIETFIIIDFVTRYLGCKYQDKRKHIGFMSAWLISFIELCVINYIFPYDEGLYALLPIIITFIYALVFLNGSIPLKLWIALLIQIIVGIIAYGTNLIVCNIIGYNPNDMVVVFNATRIICVIITKIILFYVSRMILRHKYKYPIDNQAWFILILIPLISMISLTALMMIAMNHNELSSYILCGMAGIVGANITTYYFFSTLSKNYETKLRIKLLEQNTENAVKNLENANAFVHQMKSVKHNMQNQLLIISDYIEHGKYVEAKNHIDSLTENYLPNIQDFTNSENEAFNAILNSKIAVCNQKKIYIEVKEMKDALKSFDAVDTGILFGNLLDNAIEAAEKTKSRKISVDIYTSGYYLSILITNSIKESVIENNSALKTTKEDKNLHGIGIESINEIVKKYDGMIQFFEENEEFCCHILLDIDKIHEYY